MKLKMVFFFGAVSLAMGALPLAAQGTQLKFDGEAASGAVLKDLMGPVDSALVPVPEIVPAPDTKRGVSTNYWSFSLDSELAANRALPVILNKLRQAGVVVLTSRVYWAEHTRPNWHVDISYLSPAGATIVYTELHFNTQAQADNELAGIVGKFENAGLVVLTTRTFRQLQTFPEWHIGICYLTSAK